MRFLTATSFFVLGLVVFYVLVYVFLVVLGLFVSTIESMPGNARLRNVE